MAMVELLDRPEFKEETEAKETKKGAKKEKQVPAATV